MVGRCSSRNSEIETECSIVFDVDQLFPDASAKSVVRRGRAHELVFAGIDLESCVIRKCGIEQAQGVGEMDLLMTVNSLSVRCERCRAHSPTPSIVRMARSLERRWIESAGSVTQMMLAEKQSAVPITVQLVELFHQHSFQEQLLPQPKRNRHPERCEAPWRKREVCLNESFELQKRLVVKHDMINGL